MCEPTTMIMMASMAALSAGSTAMSIKQQNDTAEAQAKASNEATKLEYKQLDRQADQETDAANQKKMERQRQALRERGKLRASFGEANVLGNSPLRQMHDALLQSSYDQSITDTNNTNALAQNDFNQFATSRKSQGRTNMAKSQASGPWTSMLNIGMSGAQGGMSGYQTGKAMET